MSQHVVTRHPELWFSDGSVELQVDDTLFCVHISQLSRHSTVFRDMFALAQPDAPDFQRARIKLYDSPEDIANMLKALYDVHR